MNPVLLWFTTIVLGAAIGLGTAFLPFLMVAALPVLALVALVSDAKRMGLSGFERPALKGPGIEVEHPGGLGPELGIAREDPAPMRPGLDRVLAEPAPDGRVADRRDQAASDDLGSDVRHLEPAEGQPEPRRQLTRDRLNRDDEVWGEKPAGDRSGSARPSRPGAPRRSACATWTRPGPAARAARRSRCSPDHPRPEAWPDPISCGLLRQRDKHQSASMLFP